MICDNCFEHMKRWGWHNNQKLCSKCLHNAQPVSRRLNAVEEAKPTIQNLKKHLEKKWTN